MITRRRSKRRRMKKRHRRRRKSKRTRKKKYMRRMVMRRRRMKKRSSSWCNSSLISSCQVDWPGVRVSCGDDASTVTSPTLHLHPTRVLHKRESGAEGGDDVNERSLQMSGADQTERGAWATVVTVGRTRSVVTINIKHSAPMFHHQSGEKQRKTHQWCWYSRSREQSTGGTHWVFSWRRNLTVIWLYLVFRVYILISAGGHSSSFSHHPVSIFLPYCCLFFSLIFSFTIHAPSFFPTSLHSFLPPLFIF